MMIMVIIIVMMMIIMVMMIAKEKFLEMRIMMIALRKIGYDKYHDDS